MQLLYSRGQQTMTCMQGKAIPPTACFSQQSLTEVQLRSFISTPPMAAFALEGQALVLLQRPTTWLARPDMVIIWPLTEKVFLPNSTASLMNADFQYSGWIAPKLSNQFSTFQY